MMFLKFATQISTLLSLILKFLLLGQSYLGLGPSANTRAPKTKNESAEISKDEVCLFYHGILFYHDKTDMSPSLRMTWTETKEWEYKINKILCHQLSNFTLTIRRCTMGLKKLKG